MLSSLAGRTCRRVQEIAYECVQEMPAVNNSVHPTAVIADDVVLGSGNVIGAFAVILGPARIGDGNWIGPHVVLGTPAEIRGIDHGLADGGIGTGVRVGNATVIREHSTIHQGHYATTVIGDGCYLMNRCYIAHDNVLDDGVTMASGVTLGGHVHVGAGANLGMGAIVHQRRVIGGLAMVGMGAVVTHDLPPGSMSYGNPCRVRGANRVGLQRAGVAEDVIAATHLAYSVGDSPHFDDEPALAEVWNRWISDTAPESS